MRLEGYQDDVASAQGHGFSATRELLAQPLRPTAGASVTAVPE